MSTRAVLAQCRAGFEAAVAEEVVAGLGAAATPLPVLANSGYARVALSGKANLQRIPQGIDSVFARQTMISEQASVVLGERDRVTPLCAAVPALLTRAALDTVAAVWVEYPDTNDGKSLTKLAGALESRISAQLQGEGYLRGSASHRLHVFLLNKQEAYIGLVDIARGSSWPLGIPRLKMPYDAPSRSTLKLAEAFHVFLGDDLGRVMQPEMRAVDLGAAPGGWTWQLTHRGLHVTAVDNADLKGELVDNALVRHVREDGFRYRPKKQVDWLTCDMVEQPRRIATLMAEWLAGGHARHAIFNLKLPMKKRLEEVNLCRAIIDNRLGESARPYRLVIKQLYHDREEVTAYCGFVPRAR